MAGWTTLKNLVQEEIKQRGEEGCDVKGYAERFEIPGFHPIAISECAQRSYNVFNKIRNS